jgi:hypothetical protein
MKKNRHAVGEKGGGAKLTEDQAKQILACRGAITAMATGKLFGVKKSTVNKIRSGVNWKHLAWQT